MSEDRKKFEHGSETDASTLASMAAPSPRITLTTRLDSLAISTPTRARLAAAGYDTFASIVGVRDEVLFSRGLVPEDIQSLERALGCTFTLQPGAVGHTVRPQPAQPFDEESEDRQIERGLVDRATFAVLSQKDRALKAQIEANEAMLYSVEVLDASRRAWKAAAVVAIIAAVAMACLAAYFATMLPLTPLS